MPREIFSIRLLIVPSVFMPLPPRSASFFFTVCSYSCIILYVTYNTQKHAWTHTITHTKSRQEPDGAAHTHHASTPGMKSRGPGIQGHPQWRDKFKATIHMRACSKKTKWNKIIKTEESGAGEIAQRLRGLATLQEDSSPIPRTYMGAQNSP